MFLTFNFTWKYTWNEIIKTDNEFSLCLTLQAMQTGSEEDPHRHKRNLYSLKDKSLNGITNNFEFQSVLVIH